jgi:hypothetical protein
MNLFLFERPNWVKKGFFDFQEYHVYVICTDDYEGAFGARMVTE